jgi:hypothetical protein
MTRTVRHPILARVFDRTSPPMEREIGPRRDELLVLVVLLDVATQELLDLQQAGLAGRSGHRRRRAGCSGPPDVDTAVGLARLDSHTEFRLRTGALFELPTDLSEIAASMGDLRRARSHPRRRPRNEMIELTRPPSCTRRWPS